MRVLTTVLAPSAGGTKISGRVNMDGITYKESNYEKIQRKIGYLPQEIDLYPGLTLQECLEYMGAFPVSRRKSAGSGYAIIWRRPA